MRRILSAAVVVLLAVSACSGGGDTGKASDAADVEHSAALKSCQEVFGVAGVDAVRAEFGGGFRAFGRSPAGMRDAMVVEARGWSAVGDDLRRTTYHPCEMEGGAGAARVTGTVGWSMYDIDSVGSGDGRLRWRTVADGVHVASRPDAWGTPLVVPCTVPGAAAGQGRELPLQVAVKDEGRKADSAVSTEQFLKALAENTRRLLGCRETVSVPADLLP
ncbi:hypothetical protein OG259_25935 [Streptomyces sp. NBC_00250]|uniref:hypothetical protein n=1 Tax=Streptomyces sp. NBC_00250 TaxID=2903641 RepID=UPI002E2AD15B|nr:hypothetical protein [Streptomyces sp. NBC_00250]